jgi:hypothetical protein
MKKIGFLCLGLVLVLGSIGVGFAKWGETLTISGIVETGEVDIEISEQLSNDPPGSGLADEAEFGRWDFGTPPVNDPTMWEWLGDRYDKDVGSIDCVLVDAVDPVEGGSVNEGNEAMEIIVTNGYPSYYGSIAFTIDNIGTVPVKVESIKLVEISGPAGKIPVDIDLVACTIYYVDVDAGTVSDQPNINGPDTDDFSIHLSELAVGQQIDPPAIGPGPEFAIADLGVHVEQGAWEQSTYDFTILITAAQWNEV